MLAQEDLKRHLSYDQETGVFTWLVPTGKRVRSGSVAGTKYSKGYIRIVINKKIYFAHRLAWLFVYGRYPHAQIDHINLDRADNRLCNLREATHQQNQWNRSKKENTSSKFIGVSRDSQKNKFVAHIKLNNKTRHLGYYDSEHEARQAYLDAKNELHAF